MKKLLLLLTVLTGSASVSAQVFWEEKPTGFASASRGVNQISYADANNVWVTVYDGITTTNVIREYARSTDGGNTWTPGVINLGVTTLGIGCIAAVDGNTAYVAAFPDTGGTGGIWKTIDGGATWNRQSTASYNSATSFTDVVHFWDADNGFTMGDPDTPTTFEIYTTTNGGTNWVRVPSANVPVPLTDEYGYTRNLYVNGDDVWFGTNKGRLYHSTNRGLNWTVAQTPIADMQTGNYAFVSSTEGLLTTDDWQFFRTTDGGATWVAETPVGVLRNGAICHVPGAPVETYVCLGNDIDLDQRGSSYSTDNGVNWTDINQLGDDVNNDNGTDVEFYDVNNGLSSGFNTSATVGGIFKYVGTQLPNKSFSGDKLFSAYVDNATRTLFVNGKNISNVTVYDVLGKQVFNGSYTSVDIVSINVDSFNSGVYMVKVANAEGNTSTIKVIKQ